VTERVTSFRNIGVVGHWYGWLLAGYYHFSYADEDSHAASTEIAIREYGRSFGVETGDAHPRLAVDREALTRVKSHLVRLGSGPENLIIIHPGPSWPVRTWPHGHWLELLRSLRERGFTNIVQIGAGVRTYTNVGAEEFPSLPETMSLVDQLSLEETIALISLARLFIGIDSGLLHFAACMQTTAVGIFGPTSPSLRFAPAFAKSFVTSRVECQGCHHRVPRLHWEKGCPYDIKCMQTITVEDVLRTCLENLPAAQN
jgi:ADP-heptose:LPS heptosyltransferase